MKEGLLWFDNDPQRSLVDKVNRAAARYQAKFGCLPTTCYVNEADFNDQVQQVNGVQMQAVTNILRHHFWIGVDNGREKSSPNGHN